MRDLVVSIARAELGNTDPTRYWTEVLPGQLIYPPHWCGAFALYCLRQARLTNWTWRVGLGFLSAPDRDGNLRWRLPRTNVPRLGDIAYRDRPYQHHAMVSEVDQAEIGTIDGNSGYPPAVRAQHHAMGGGYVYYSIEPLLHAIP